MFTKKKFKFFGGISGTEISKKYWVFEKYFILFFIKKVIKKIGEIPNPEIRIRLNTQS